MMTGANDIIDKKNISKLFESEVKIINFKNLYSFEHLSVNNNCEKVYKIHIDIQKDIQKSANSVKDQVKETLDQQKNDDPK